MESLRSLINISYCNSANNAHSFWTRWSLGAGGNGGADLTRRAIVHRKTLLHLWKSHWCSGWPYMETHLIVNNFMMLPPTLFPKTKKMIGT
jgi:hypothetical protein